MWTGGLPTQEGYLTYVGFPTSMYTGPKRKSWNNNTMQ